MIRTRPFLFSLGLILLVAVGAGFYLYQNLPELLRLQAQRYLQQYGVDDIAFEGLYIDHNNASVDTLTMRGSYENYAYEVTLVSAELLYDWRGLLGGKLDTLSVSSLAISIDQTGGSSRANQQPIALGALLPHRVVAQLPLGSLSIPQWSLIYRSPKLQPITANGSVALDQQLHARLSTSLAERQIQAELQSNTLSGDTRISLSLAGSEAEKSEQKIAIATLIAELSSGIDEGWQWDLQGRVQYAPALSWLHAVELEQNLALGIPPADEFSAQGESALTAQVQHPDALSFGSGPGAAEALLQQLQLNFQLSNEVRELTIRNSIEGVSAAVTVAGNSSAGRVETTVQPFQLAGGLSTQLLMLPAEWVQWLKLSDNVRVVFELSQPMQVTSPGPGQWSVQTDNALLSLGDTDSRISVQKLKLDTAVNAAEQVEAKTTLHATFNTRLKKQTFPALQIAFSQDGDAGSNAFSLRVSDTAESMHANLEGTHSLAAQTGSYQLNAQITDLPYFWTSVAPLLRHFQLLQDTVEIRSGRMRLETTLNGETYDIANWQQRSKLTLEDTAGSFNAYGFDGLALSAQWSGITRWKTLTPLEVTLARLSLGFAMQDIQLRASLPAATAIAQPQVRIEAFSAGMFGGRLVLPDTQQWDFAAPSNSITVQAEQWQLGEMVALQQNADIEATGQLKGELPLTITDGRIIIQKGYLRALPPGGSIRYNPNEKARALASSNPELQLALNLLSDFQYQVLSSEVELDKAGNLLLGLSLAGSNPSQYDGQAVNFNINVEQNLDPLLQSLRLSDNLVKEIESGLK